MGAVETDEVVLDVPNEDEADAFWTWFAIVLTVLSVAFVAISAQYVLTLIQIVSFINSFAE